MTPIYLNSSSSSPFPAAEYHNDLHHDHPIFFSPNNIYDDQAAGHAASLSSYHLSTRIFFNSSSITTQDDHSVFFHKELQQPHIQQDQADNFDSHGGSYYDIENESTSDNGLKFSIWKKEDKYENHQQRYHESTSTYNKVEWIPSKIRLMHKMKNNIDPTAVSDPPPSATTQIKLEDQIKEQVTSSPMETDNSGNTASLNNSTNPIRVCSDCNTTKTPLWRGGPQGPKSLCNACGIRQRKARRAMAAAAAAAAANGTSLDPGTTVLVLKTMTKTAQKEKRSSSTSSGHNVAKHKKRRSKLTSIGPTSSSSHDQHQGRINKLCFEDFLISLTNNLANFHQVFPQDEKEAAILLMALSCDHTHG